VHLDEIRLWEMAKGLWWPMKVVGVSSTGVFLKYLNTDDYT
jgi:hypothetical protein